MLERIIAWSLRNRVVVIAAWLGLIALGVHSLSRLSIDAFPDTTPVQVQINTVAAALGPVEIEQRITLPVEGAISGLPGLVNVRSLSKYGLSQVTATFEDGTDTYLARQVITERLNTVELPPGLEAPQLGPVATGLGEIFHYLVTGKGDRPATLAELTSAQEWLIKPQLRTVPGVAEINTWGGEIRQFHAVIDPARLIKHALTLDTVVNALRENNIAVGGGYIVSAGEATIVQGTALTSSLEQIAGVVVAAYEGVPVRVRDLGEVREDHEIRRGAVTAGGSGEVVMGLGFMLSGESSHEVSRRLENRLEELRPTLPDNIDVRIVYRRTELVDRVIDTVKKNLAEGAVLVIAVLFAFLGNLRAGLIVALAIPLAMLFSFNAMLSTGIAASLLSLGAIDFGLIVDSSVIVVENSVRRLGHEREHPPPDGPRPVADIVRDATVEVRRPTMFGELIIMVVYLPILLLEGVEGKLFQPMALTVVFALAGSLLFSMTLAPVLCAVLLKRHARERENAVVRAAQRLYRPAVRFALHRRWTVVIIGAVLLALGALLAARLGTAFIPRLYEESIVINTVRLAGVSLDESVRYGTQIEKAILEKYPDEVRTVWSRTGTAEVATDPMGPEVTDVFIMLHPRQRWTRARTQGELTELMSTELAGLPGMRMIFTQPIELRMNEITAGVRSDLGVTVFGDDLDALRNSAAQIQSVLDSIPGSADTVTEQVTGQPVLEIAVDQDAIARYGIPAARVLDFVQAIGEIDAGEIRHGQRRLDLIVRLPDRYRTDPDAVRELLIPTAAGERIPLERLARITHTEGPSTVNREWGKRRVVVQCNVRGRDLGSFVAEARERIAHDITLPAGYFVAYGGQYEHLQRASRRLAIIVPLCLASILVLLYLSTGTFRDSLIVLTGAPFAALGGVLALWLLNMDFTIAAAVGFIAVSGVSMLGGLVLVSTIKQRLADGLPMDEAIEQTRLIRLRPILMTALVASIGFLPMAVNTGVGAEVQRPLAVVVIAGVLTDNVLTLVLLPALYSLFGRTPGQRPPKAGEAR